MQSVIDIELKKHGFSATKPRRLVYDALERSGSISMNQIEQATKSHVDRASVYRTMRLFEELGFVRRIAHGWKYTFELSDVFSRHHHHLACRICNTVVELDDVPELENAIHTMANPFLYTSLKHEVEISGVCPNCSKI